jgi:hypothetical protein
LDFGFWILDFGLKFTQLTCRGAPCGYPRIEELVTLITGAKYELKSKSIVSTKKFLKLRDNATVIRITNSLVEGAHERHPYRLIVRGINFLVLRHPLSDKGCPVVG